jgi:hypothetical protein
MKAAHKAEIDALTLKYTACQERSGRLEAKLKPTLLGKVKRWVEYGAAFAAGRLSARVF